MWTGLWRAAVSDLAHLLAVMAGYDERWPLSLADDPRAFSESLRTDLGATRVAWLGDWGGNLPMEDGVLECCRAAFPALESIGCTIEDALPDFDPEALWRAWLVLRQWLTLGTLGPLYADPAKRTQMKPEAQWEVECGLRLSARDVYQASMVRSAWYTTVLWLFERFDELLLPSAQVFPFDAGLRWPREIGGVAMDIYHRWMQVTSWRPWPGCLRSACPSDSTRTGCRWACR